MRIENNSPSPHDALHLKRRLPPIEDLDGNNQSARQRDDSHSEELPPSTPAAPDAAPHEIFLVPIAREPVRDLEICFY